MKFVSWNVNGLRACIQKGFLEQFQQMDADFFCLQETKLSEGQLQLSLPGYEQYWCYAEKKGYSGTAIFTKHHPLSVSYGIGVPELDNEGRVITLEYQEFYLVTCYTPNAQRGLARLDHRMTWDEAFRGYLQQLDKIKPVVICGDLNVAHKEIDLKNPSSNRGNAGFSGEERQSFQKTLDLGFTDTFRHLYPDAVGCYSWWSYMFHARENNAGWRIDYFLTSNRLSDQIQEAAICSNILGSDHCPVVLELDTLVNGGIWSPTAGTPTVIETETSKKKTAKASPVNGKALGLLCLLLAITLVITGIPSFIQGKEPDETTPTTLDPNALFVCQVLPQSFTMVAKPGTSCVLLFEQDRLTYMDDSYYIADFDAESLTSANFWIRLDLTELGKTIYRDDLQLYIKCLSDMLSSSSISSIQTANFSVIPYYADEAHTEALGWLVWGYLYGDDSIGFSLPEYEFTTFAKVRVTPYFSVEPLAVVPKLIRSGDGGSILRFGDLSLSVDPQAAQNEDQLIQADFWLYLNISNDGLELLGEDEFSLNYVSVSVTGAKWYVNSFPCYSFIEPDVVNGYILYGKNIVHIYNIAIGNENARLTHPDTQVIVPYMDADAAVKLSTKDLIEYILSNQGIVNDLRSGTSADILMDRYPVIAALMDRSNAGEILMNYFNSFDKKDPAKILATHWFQLHSDELVQSVFNIADVCHYDSPIQIGTEIVDDMLRCCLTASDGTYYTELAATNTDDISFAFRLQIKEPYIGQFTGNLQSWTGGSETFDGVNTIRYYTDHTRQTLAGIFFIGASDVKVISNIELDNITVYYGDITVQHFDLPETYASMSTMEVLEIIMGSETIKSDILNPEPGQEAWMETLCARYLVLQEFFLRSDAKQAMQDWIIDHGQDDVIERLAYYWLYTIAPKYVPMEE